MARCSTSAIILVVLCTVQQTSSQLSSARRDNATSGWEGRRVVALKGFGEYFAQMEDGETKLVKPDGLSVNIVAVVQKAEGDRVWIKANGNGDRPVGWINRRDAVLLEDAIPYFTTKITREPSDWDSFLRRAESEHALNRRDEAIADYTSAIKLNGHEPFLFLRRGREYRILKDCPHAASDFEQAARLRPGWAEAYDMAAGVYADCPDPSHRDQAKAIELINRAMALSPNPTYLTVLALAYFRSGDLERAVTSQKQAVESPQFPPGYRDDALRQLQIYKKALAAEKR